MWTYEGHVKCTHRGHWSIRSRHISAWNLCFLVCTFSRFTGAYLLSYCLNLITFSSAQLISLPVLVARSVFAQFILQVLCFCRCSLQPVDYVVFCLVEWLQTIQILLIDTCQLYLTRACVLLSALSGRPHLHSSEDNKLFVQRSLNASIGPWAFCSSGPTSWNTLPAPLRHSSLTLEQFKCLLKASLFAWLSLHAPYWQFSVICAFWSVLLLLFFLYPRYLGSWRSLEKKLIQKRKLYEWPLLRVVLPNKGIVQHNAVISLHERAGTKMQSPARRQNVGWFSSLEVRENQRLIH